MNRSNVWTLTDLADARGLRKAIANAPSCVNVCGWSYASGKRRGIIKIEANAATTASELDQQQKKEKEKSATQSEAEKESNSKQDPDAEQTADDNNTSNSDTDHHNVRWEVSDVSGAQPAAILHYAALRGSIECTICALENGASSDVLVHGCTADAIALGFGHDDIARLIQQARRRQGNPLQVVEDEEEQQRGLTEMKERAGYERLLSSLEDGVASVELRFRDCGVTQVEHVSVPRYVGFHTFQAKVEDVFKQRVLLSFVASPSALAAADNRAPSRSDASVPRSSANGRSSTALSERSDGGVTADGGGGTGEGEEEDEEERARRKQKRFIELNSKTIMRFLHMPKPVCAVRALVSGMGDMSFGGSLNQSHGGSVDQSQRSASPAASNNKKKKNSNKRGSVITGSNYTHLLSNSGLAEHLNSVQRGPQRIDQIKKLLNEIEKPEVFGKKLSAEERDAALDRLYSRPMRAIEEKKREHEEFCATGTVKYMNTTKKMAPTLSEREEEIVHKLFDEGVARKEASRVRAEEALQERVPKPHQKTLDQSELDDLGDRLWKKCEARKKENVEKATRRVYGDGEERKVVDLDALVDSVYTRAVDKKKTAVERLTGEYGDFRSKKPQKKLTPAQIKEMGERLCTK